MDFTREKQIEAKLRKQSWIVPLLTGIIALLLISVVLVFHHFFTHGYHWIIVPAAFAVHAFFIVVVHDGAHKAITRSSVDRFIMNTGAAVMLLPIYGELFRKYHLIHHAHTNEDVDPLWTPVRKKIFTKHRSIYVICELIPFAFKLFLLFTSNTNSPIPLKRIKKPTVSIGYILYSFTLTLCLIYFLKPSIWFVLGTLLVLNIISLLRHWCEHTGPNNQKQSNTFWFPLGMGIGNHEAHHNHPHFSWITMMIGLWSRKKDTHPLKTLWGIAFTSKFNHYTKTR